MFDQLRHWSHEFPEPARFSEFLEDHAQLTLFTRLKMFLDSRCFFLGKEDWDGLAEKGVQKGDQFAFLFPKQHIPFIIRREKECYQIIGVA